MGTKRNKYDTNPLDERVADRAGQSFDSSRPGAPTEDVAGRPTHNIRGRNDKATVQGYSESEAPTRRIDDNLTSSYPSVFIKPPPRQAATYQAPRVPMANIYQPPPGSPPSVYQPPPLPVAQRRPHSVAGLGISEKWANLFPYIPGHIGAIAAVIELLLVPRTEARARFHAAQGLALQIAILIITGAFQFLTLVTGSSIGSVLFRTASTVFLVVSMIRVFQGKPHHIAPLDDATRWLDEKIKPRK